MLDKQRYLTEDDISNATFTQKCAYTHRYKQKVSTAQSLFQTLHNWTSKVHITKFLYVNEPSSRMWIPTVHIHIVQKKPDVGGFKWAYLAWVKRI